MKKDEDYSTLGWYMLRFLAFMVIAFLLAFPLSYYANNLAYPTVASLAILFQVKLTEGSMPEFVFVVIYMLTVYFLFSFLFFLYRMVEWIVRKFRSGV
jgi:hypothetical protein